MTEVSIKHAFITHLLLLITQLSLRIQLVSVRRQLKTIFCKYLIHSLSKLTQRLTSLSLKHVYSFTKRS